MAPESLYSKTPWRKKAIPGTESGKMRFCQAKFFMLDDKEESPYPSSVIGSVNKTSKELFHLFNQMSELAKKGGDPLFVDNCYCETLSSLATALKLRSLILGTTP
jgi:hypothetical protein